MTTLRVECDTCGVDTDDFVEHYDGESYCKLCELKQNAQGARHAYQSLRKWLHNTHLKRLNELRGEMIKADNDLRELQGDTHDQL